VTLEQAIETHRELYRADTLIDRLVARQPPTTLDLNTGILHVEDGTRIGMTMSGRLLKYVGHPEGYGADFPWSKALWLLRVECRRRHHDHRAADRPYWRGSLCHEAVKLVVIGGESGGTGPLSPEHAGRILRIDRIDELLLRAFRFLEESMDSFRRRAELRAREDEGRGDGAIPVPRAAHHAVPGLHKQDCPQCRRAA
jgi:hypothetical protein